MLTRRLRNGKSPKSKFHSHKLETQVKLENIYLDLHNIYQSYLSSPSTDKIPNPFMSFYHWNLKRLIRYRDADQFPGRESLAIVMHSSVFSSAMDSLEELDWMALLAAIYENRDSIRMFALMRHIPYVLSYDRSPLPVSVGRMPPQAYCRSPCELLQAQHPHEVYLTSSGNIARCEIDGRKIVNITENIYHEDVFREYPRGDAWPENWEYPRDPTFVAPMANGLFPNCWQCKKSMGPTHPGPSQPHWVVFHEERCVCTERDIFKEPLIEVRQFPPMPGDPKGHNTLNRGVRTLSCIKEGDILAEYLGDIAPKTAEDAVGDDVYLFSMWGPLLRNGMNADSGRETREFGPSIAVVTAAWRGNWTRFMNHMAGGKHNVDFETLVVGYKVRILAIARKDIGFGEELTVNYGTEYFTSEWRGY